MVWPTLGSRTAKEQNINILYKRTITLRESGALIEF